ncbi:uncharacterized protein LOC144656046 [Oculina patagonica]
MGNCCSPLCKVNLFSNNTRKSERSHNIDGPGNNNTGTSSFSSCKHCKEPILQGQEVIQNYHKFPCYSDKNRKCCECNAKVDDTSTSIYCKTCYDSRFPPPLRLDLRDNQGNRVLCYSRDDLTRKVVTSMSDRMLTDGRTRQQIGYETDSD